MKIDKKAPGKVVIMTLQGADVKEWKRVYWKVNIKKTLAVFETARVFFMFTAWRRRRPCRHRLTDML